MVRVDRLILHRYRIRKTYNSIYYIFISMVKITYYMYVRQVHIFYDYSQRLYLHFKLIIFNILYT